MSDNLQIFGQDGQYFPLNPFEFYYDQSGAGGIATRVMSYQQRCGNGQPKDEYTVQWINNFLAQYARMYEIAEIATAKLYVALHDHKETATMASHNHESNIPLAQAKIVDIDREIEETKALSQTFGRRDQTILVHSDSESSGDSGRSTPMEMDN